jgi:SAM-dependent methyltransferase
VSDGAFYGADQAVIHHTDFGAVATRAARHLLRLIKPPGRVVDLGCGSGILADIVSRAGFETRGYDISPAMVDLATKNAPHASFEVSPALDVELPANTAAVTAIGEVLNYATDPRHDLDAILEHVHQALRPGGLFLFDVATPGRGGPNKERWALHQKDDYAMFVHIIETDGTLERVITIFKEAEPGLYRRSDEHHRLRLYDPADITERLDHHGFRVTMRDDYPGEPKSPDLPGWVVFEANKPQ